jgi:hypothetical protein
MDNEKNDKKDEQKSNEKVDSPKQKSLFTAASTSNSITSAVETQQVIK